MSLAEELAAAHRWLHAMRTALEEADIPVPPQPEAPRSPITAPSPVAHLAERGVTLCGLSVETRWREPLAVADSAAQATCILCGGASDDY